MVLSLQALTQLKPRNFNPQRSTDPNEKHYKPISHHLVLSGSYELRYSSDG